MARYANDTVCHIWASGKLTSGQSNNGQLFFDCRTLYSYGRHYAVGVIMPDNVVMLNSSKASVTTSRHCSYAARATSHMTRHYVPELEDIASALAARDKREDWQESAIARHARKHALAMTIETLAYLMQCAGLSPSKAAKAAKAAKAQAEREAAAKAAKAAKRANDAALAAARHYAALTSAEREAAIAHLSGQWSPINALKAAASNARKAHKAAKARGWNGIAARVWQYIRALDGKRHWLEKRAAYRASRATLSQSIARLRAAWPNYERGQSETWELSRIAEWAEYIADNGKGLRDTGKVAMRAIASNARQIAADKQAAIAAERYARESEKREAWLNGASGYWRGNDSNGGALIRATGVERDESGTITGGTLETSQGASVPLIHAIRIFQIARACREAGRGVEPKARVGFYTVDKVDSSGGFNAGCHRINWPEIERLARQLEIYP